MSRIAWVGLGTFFAGILCVVLGVLLSPERVPGEPPNFPPFVLGLLIAGAVLVMVGGRFGLYPFIQWVVQSGKIPTWLWILFFLVMAGVAGWYLFFRGP